MSESVFDENGHVELVDEVVLIKVLRELAGPDALIYRGSVGCWGEQNPPGPAKWNLEINDDKGNITTATIGQHLVRVYGRLIVLSDEEYQAG